MIFVPLLMAWIFPTFVFVWKIDCLIIPPLKRDTIDVSMKALENDVRSVVTEELKMGFLYNNCFCHHFGRGLWRFLAPTTLTDLGPERGNPFAKWYLKLSGKFISPERLQ